jgi:hypothetical protein
LSAIELPADIIEFRERALEFLRTNVHPLEQQVAETGVLDLKEYETLRKRAREELRCPNAT